MTRSLRYTLIGLFTCVISIHGLYALAPIGSSPFLSADQENGFRFYFGHAIGVANLHPLPGGNFRKFQDVGSGLMFSLHANRKLGLQAGMLGMNSDKGFFLNANFRVREDEYHYLSIAPGILYSSGESKNRHYTEFYAYNTEDNAEVIGVQLPIIYTIDSQRHSKLNACVKATYLRVDTWGSYTARDSNTGLFTQYTYDFKDRESFIADASLGLDAYYGSLIMSYSVGLMLLDTAQKGTTGAITYGLGLGVLF